MPVNYSGNESLVTADRADVTVSLPVDGDARNALSVNTPFQRLANFMQRVRKKAGFLDIASTWTTLQTFSAGLAGTTASLTGNATVGGTLGVTGALTVASLNTGSGAISGGAVSGTTGTFSGAVTAASLGAATINVSDDVVVGGDLTVAASLVAPNVSGNMTIAGTLSATAVDGGTWIAIGSSGSSFGTNWANGDNSVSFRKTPWGEVVFKGMAKATGGTGDITVLTLPASHRPTADRYVIISGAGGSVPYQTVIIRIISSTGAVNVYNGSHDVNTQFHLDSLRFAI